jgi:HPt (histidine-containing phosphotransfer) domain-containing protein
LLKETLQILLDECPKLLQEIRECLASRDAKRLRRAAHTLKGAADVFAARRAVAAALHMEQLGKDERLDDAENAVQDLEAEVETLCTAIKETLSSV